MERVLTGSLRGTTSVASYSIQNLSSHTQHKITETEKREQKWIGIAGQHAFQCLPCATIPFGGLCRSESLAPAQAGGAWSAIIINYAAGHAPIMHGSCIRSPAGRFESPKCHHNAATDRCSVATVLALLLVAVATNPTASPPANLTATAPLTPPPTGMVAQGRHWKAC